MMMAVLTLRVREDCATVRLPDAMSVTYILYGTGSQAVCWDLLDGGRHIFMGPLIFLFVSYS